MSKELEIIKCSSWDDFIKIIRERGGSHKDERIIFRGQHDPSWGLVPHLFRYLIKDFKPELIVSGSNIKVAVSLAHFMI